MSETREIENLDTPSCGRASWANTLPDIAGMPRRMRSRRKKLDITQAQVDARAGFHDRTYVHYEAGRRSPGPEILAKIALALNTTCDYLVGIKRLP